MSLNAKFLVSVDLYVYNETLHFRSINLFKLHPFFLNVFIFLLTTLSNYWQDKFFYIMYGFI